MFATPAFRGSVGVEESNLKKTIFLPVIESKVQISRKKSCLSPPIGVAVGRRLFPPHLVCAGNGIKDTVL